MECKRRGVAARGRAQRDRKRKGGSETARWHTSWRLLRTDSSFLSLFLLTTVSHSFSIGCGFPNKKYIYLLFCFPFAAFPQAARTEKQNITTEYSMLLLDICNCCPSASSQRENPPRHPASPVSWNSKAEPSPAPTRVSTPFNCASSHKSTASVRR